MDRREVSGFLLSIKGAGTHGNKRVSASRPGMLVDSRREHHQPRKQDVAGRHGTSNERNKLSKKLLPIFFANKISTYRGVRIPGFWKVDPQSRVARPFARDLGGEDFRSPSRGFEVAETTTTALAWSYGKYWIALAREGG
jgi:hypothetical protein